MISLNSNYFLICSSLCPDSAVDIMWKIKQDLLFTQVKQDLWYRHDCLVTQNFTYLSNIPFAIASLISIKMAYKQSLDAFEQLIILVQSEI